MSDEAARAYAAGDRLKFGDWWREMKIVYHEWRKTVNFRNRRIEVAIRHAVMVTWLTERRSVLMVAYLEGWRA